MNTMTKAEPLGLSEEDRVLIDTIKTGWSDIGEPKGWRSFHEIALAKLLAAARAEGAARSQPIGVAGDRE